MFPRSLYSWTKSWCSPKTKTKTRFLNVKRNFLAKRPTERSASRCAHSPEISSFSLRVYTYIYITYIHKRVFAPNKRREKFVSIRELFALLRLLNVIVDRGSIRAFRPYDKSNRASAKRLVILRRAETRWKGNQSGGAEALELEKWREKIDRATI